MRKEMNRKELKVLSFICFSFVPLSSCENGSGESRNKNIDKRKKTERMKERTHK